MTVSQELKNQIENALSKTGFPLENYVCNLLDKLGWHVISGRYYCDDIDGRAREIDILAYKIGLAEKVDVVSVLLVSCKKDHANSWVFLSKKKPKKDPNYIWDPICLWSFNPLIKYLSEKAGLDVEYRESAGSLRGQLIEVESNVFAFQQVSANGPQNDKAIFGSIESLIKAREHELATLVPKTDRQKKLKKRRVYVFNLLTVVDANMYEAFYRAEKCSIRQIKNIKYLARYIVNKVEVLAKVQFVSKGECNKVLKKFNSLAEREIKFFDGKFNEVFENWANDPYRKFFVNELAGKVRALLKPYIKDIDDEDFDLMFDIKAAEDGAMIIELGLDAEEIARLGKLKALNRRVAKLLLEEMWYSGEFKFAESLPF